MKTRNPGLVLALCLAFTALGGCSALTSIQTAAKVLDAYELTPLPPANGARSRGHLLVETPTASGALATDRIAVKPDALQVQYLPDARWVDEAPDHVKLLLVRSLGNSGGFSLVSGQGAGPDPDHILLTDLQAFQFQVGQFQVGAPGTVAIRLTATLLRAEDRQITASRSFEQLVAPASDQTDAIVTAFDAAMTAVLTEATAWVLRNTR